MLAGIRSSRLYPWAAILLIVAAAVTVICAWIYCAGPNTDTLLSYHRNHLAHHLSGMMQILAAQDQAPLAQLFHYALQCMGFSSVVALQAVSSALAVVGVVGVFAVDLNTENRYRVLKASQRTWIYTFAAIAIIISANFSASLTWVRYAVIIGVMWYAVWVLEIKWHTATGHQAQRYAWLMGLLLGIGPLVSYTWGVVIVASILSLTWQGRLRSLAVWRRLLAGVLPGALLTLIWLAYAGSQHIALILLRTHGTPFHWVKFIGKAWHLITYPWVGLLLFPSVVNGLIMLGSLLTVGVATIVFLRSQRELIVPFLCHTLLPIPFFLATSVTSGYSMIGPGLILLSCAIKGVLRRPLKQALCFSMLGMAVLIGGMVVNLRGFNSMSPMFHANKSRAAIEMVRQRLLVEQALNQQTLVVATDESGRFLIEALPLVHRRFLTDALTSNAPNLEAMLRMGYTQDALTPSIERVMIIVSDNGGVSAQQRAISQWLLPRGFKPTPFRQEVAPYSSWLKRATSTDASAEYWLEEWIKS